MWFVAAAVPYHKTVAQLIPGKSGVNWACPSGGDSPAVPYLLTMTLTVRFAQSAPFIRVKKCLKSRFHSLRNAMMRINRYVSRGLHICHSMAFRLKPTKVRICSVCLISLKKVSMLHRQRYKSHMLEAAHSILLLRKLTVISLPLLSRTMAETCLKLLG